MSTLAVARLKVMRILAIAVALPSMAAMRRRLSAATIRRLSVWISTVPHYSGGIMMTIMGTSMKTLLDAPAHLDKYPGLRVHWGLFAYFIALSRAQQNIIIHRTKYRL